MHDKTTSIVYTVQEIKLQTSELKKLRLATNNLLYISQTV